MSNRKQRRKNKSNNIYDSKEWKIGVDDGSTSAIAIVLMAFLDSGRLKDDEMQDAYSEICYKADSVKQGYTKIEDFIKVLYDEYGINLKGNSIR